MPALAPTDVLIAKMLVGRGLLRPDQRDEAFSMCARWGVRLRDVVLARNWIRPQSFYAAVASHYDLPFVDMFKEPPEAALADSADSNLYLQHLFLPWRRENGRVIVATADPTPDVLELCRARFGRDVSVVMTSKFDVIWLCQRLFQTEYSEGAVYELAKTDPIMSAERVFTSGQIWLAYMIFTGVCLAVALAPLATFVALNVLMTFFYLGNFLFKAVLAWFGEVTQDRKATLIEEEVSRLIEDELPIFTILVPMYKEPEVLPILAHALRQLDYPLGKLDIKLVLEEGDFATIDAARNLGLEGIFEIIRVPPSQPQTKPKACNYALRFARGEFLVIFDAEDKPEPDQLKKVVAAFRLADPKTACVQCRLNYYNAHENWLTRMFTLDYSMWFDLLLPGLERLGIPIPLGGTSNHFRLDVLRSLHAWDPFNVTEDADLGIRLTQKGYRVDVIDSTTYEEANVHVGNWIRQRSRWIKGYMQTFLVHNRRPFQLIKDVGLRGSIGFTFFIGGTMLAGILNPLFWATFVAWLIVGADSLEQVFPPVVLYLGMLNLVLGNGAFIYTALLAPVRRGWTGLVPFALTAPAYWVLMSIAAYKGLWQLLVNPFYWEKTQHGLSKQIAAELEKVHAANLSLQAGGSRA